MPRLGGERSSRELRLSGRVAASRAANADRLRAGNGVRQRHSGDTDRGLRVFHISTSRFSSLIGSGLSSTCSRRIVSLCSQTPQFFFTITIAADC